MDYLCFPKTYYHTPFSDHISGARVALGSQIRRLPNGSVVMNFKANVKPVLCFMLSVEGLGEKRSVLAVSFVNYIREIVMF